jgi:hypothetical protein
MASLEREIDRLYTLPLGEFTAARNQLAKRAKKAGDAEAAERIRRLVKPTAPVWAINQAARADQTAVRELLNAADAFRRAQERALTREDAASSLRNAQRAEREAVRRLATGARRALEQDGRPLPRTQLDRIERTIDAAALDEEARPLLQAGRLTHELEPAGFEALAGMRLPPGARPARKGEKRSAQRSPRHAQEQQTRDVVDELAARRRIREEREQRRRQRIAAQKTAREADRRAREAELEARRAQRVAEDARHAAEKARRQADEAAAALEEFEQTADR